MNRFSTFIESLSDNLAVDTIFTKDDIIEMLEYLEPDEIQELGEYIVELTYEEDWDDEIEDEMDESTINEKKYFDKKMSVVNREKKIDKATKRKKAKERKRWYKKNKAKIKRKQKLYRRKVKRQPNLVRHHR